MPTDTVGDPKAATQTSRHPPTTTLAALPGQSAVDLGLIDETVLEINAAVDRGGLATMRSVATILLDKMFRDETGRFLQDCDHHASYLELARHPDLSVSKAALWYAVAIEGNLRELGPGSEKLSVSHHRRLVHVASIDERKALAARVLDEGLSVQALESLIAANQPSRPTDAPRLGRPPQPEPIKHLRKVDKAIASLDTQALDSLDDADAAALLAQAEATQRALDQWLQALRGRFGQQA